MHALRAAHDASCRCEAAPFEIRGTSYETLEAMWKASDGETMERRLELDTKGWHGGQVTGAIYHGEKAYTEFVGRVYGMFAFCNPLHAALHPATRQMDAEVVQMVVNLYRGGEGCCGAFTTGGTESILMAVKAYRDWARATRGVTRPNIVVCTTAHAAFDKAVQDAELKWVIGKS